MVKNAISDYSSTAASNTDVGGVNIDEGMSPSGVNNAIRELMSHLADLNAGTSSLGTIKVDNLQLDGNAITSTDTNGNITLTPNGTGNVVIDGINYPQADGTANYFLKTDGAGQLSFAQVDTASIADDAVTSAKIADNNVGAAELNVSGNGTSGQFLASDGDGTFSWADAGGGFSYNSVSGTTPSLDLGSYNFFNQGALTGNTTVSFASVPTEHKWTYTYDTDGAATSDITKLSFSGESSLPTGYSASGVFFKPDGTVAFFSDYNQYNISAHNLSTAWDISTMSTAANSQLSHESTDNRPFGLYFKSDGTKLFVAGNQNRNVYEWTLSTAWDLTTASLTNTCNVDGIVNATADTYGGDTNGVSFKSDGTVMLVCTEYRLYEYSLSTAWDTSTASYTAGSFLDLQEGGDLSTGNGSTSYNEAHFNSDGTKIFATSYSLDTIVSISLNTAYDLSSGVSSDTASTKFNSMTGNYYNAEDTVRGMYVRNDDEFYLTGNAAGGRIDKFVLISVYTLTLPSSVQEVIDTTFYNHRVSLDFFTADGGTNVHLIGQSQKRIK